jgi:hypothetical protein
MWDILGIILIFISLATAVFSVWKVVRISNAAKREAVLQEMQGPDPIAPNPLRVSLTCDDAEKEMTVALAKVEKWHGWTIKTSREYIVTAEANWTTTLEQALGKSDATSTPMKTKVKLTINIRKVGMGRETEITWRYDPECVGWQDPSLRCENPETDEMCKMTNLAIWEQLGAFDGKTTAVRRESKGSHS